MRFACKEPTQVHRNPCEDTMDFSISDAPRRSKSHQSKINMYMPQFLHYGMTLCFATAHFPTSGNAIEDQVESGNYLIAFCKANTAAYLQTLIPFMQSSLQAVLTDLDRGIASPAYRAFFKTNANVDAVRQVFTDIINGPNILMFDAQDVAHWASPTIVCADGDEPLLHLLREQCDSPIRPVANILQPARIVSICPIFWTLPRIARKAACPWVVDGELKTEPWNLRTTQYAVLVHELVHVYNRFDDRNEVYNMADVVGLNATRSLENAQNFASYAAGKW